MRLVMFLLILSGCDYLKQLKYDYYKDKGKMKCIFNSEPKSELSGKSIYFNHLNTNSPSFKIDNQEVVVSKSLNIEDGLILSKVFHTGEYFSIVAHSNGTLLYTYSALGEDEIIHYSAWANCK